MYQDVIKQANEAITQITQPVQKINGVVIAHSEKVIERQLDAARTYSDIALQRARAALEVNDPQSFQAFWQEQANVAKQVAEKAVQDAKELASIGESFTQELQGVAKESTQAIQKAAQQGQPKGGGARKSA